MSTEPLHELNDMLNRYNGLLARETAAWASLADALTAAFGKAAEAVREFGEALGIHTVTADRRLVLRAQMRAKAKGRNWRSAKPR